MNSTQIASFIAAAETGSFTEAAERMFLSQQAVSKNIISLEKELGATLFQRQGRGAKLTEAGEFYYQLFYVKNLDLVKLSEKVRRDYANLSRRFHIGYSVWIDPFGEIDAGIAGFRDKHPETRFSGRQYHNNELFDQLSSGNLDVILMSEAQVAWISEFEKAAVAYEDICLYAPSCVPDEHIDQKLWGLTLLLNASWQWTYFEWSQILVKELGDLRIESDQVLTIPNMQSIFAELLCGDCLIISDNNFGHARNYKNMRRFHIDSDSTLCCLWSKGNENPLVDEFIDHLQRFYKFEPR